MRTDVRRRVRGAGASGRASSIGTGSAGSSSQRASGVLQRCPTSVPRIRGTSAEQCRALPLLPSAWLPPCLALALASSPHPLSPLHRICYPSIVERGGSSRRSRAILGPAQPTRLLPRRSCDRLPLAPARSCSQARTRARESDTNAIKNQARRLCKRDRASSACAQPHRPRPLPLPLPPPLGSSSSSSCSPLHRRCRLQERRGVSVEKA